MATDLDIEQPGELVRYLRETGRLRPGENPAVRVLAGGVSNRTVLLDRTPEPSWVVKQALGRLRVASEWEADPERVHREALALRWLERLLPGVSPRFLGEDFARHLLWMEAVPEPHENWKTRLLAGRIEADLVREFGALLGGLHRRAAEVGVPALARDFGDRSFFRSLRLEPYYRHTATRNPSAAVFLQILMDETLATQLTLVHGDYSPKNILVRSGRLVLLDHEVMHLGDPAFDLGFSLTHLLAKSVHRPAQRDEFLAAAALHADSWAQAAGPLATAPGLAARAVRHTLACLLARVDGRSPLEYLEPGARDAIRAAALDLMPSPPASLRQLVAQLDRQWNARN